MKTATNPETGETLVLVGDAWQKADRTATGPNGTKAYLVSGQWLTGTPTAPQKPAEPTFADRDRAFATGLKSGLVGLAGLPMDTVQGGYNLLKAAVGTPLVAMGRPDLAPEPTTNTPLSSEWITRKLAGAGVEMTNPRPDDAASRMLNVGGMVVGGSMVPGATPLGTAAAATGAAVASETLGPEWAGVGAMAPAAASQGIREMRNAVAARTAPTVQAFKDAGAEVSVGQATGSAFIQGLENLAAKFPGGVGTMRKFAEAQQQAMGAKAKTGVSGEDAGRAIEKGIRGDGGFVDRFKAKQDVLYDKLDLYIPKDKMMDVSRTKEALASLNADIPGAPNVSQFFKNEKIQSIENALVKDTSGMAAAEKHMNPFQLAMAKTLPMSAKDRKEIFSGFDQGQLPYEAVKKLRTLVGREITDSTIASSVPKSKWKALYAALSDDLGTAAKQQGKRAEDAWSLANNYSKAGMDRIEKVLDRVIGNARQPEDIFKNFMPTDADQANKVRSVMRSLDPSERQIVTDAVVNRLGKAAPGRQNEVGEVFSSETFLTNWNKLSPGAKAQLFPNHAVRTNVESIAKASSNIREASKRLANPSGTAGAAAPYGLGAMAATGMAVPAAALIGGTYIGAKMFTSPRVVEWLATPVRADSQQAVSHLARLSVIYNQSDDPQLKQELETFISNTARAGQ